jgi:hypothetical protein
MRKALAAGLVAAVAVLAAAPHARGAAPPALLASASVDGRTEALAPAQVARYFNVGSSFQFAVTSVMLYAAAASAPYVSGWWLNDPAAGQWCPKCTGPYPWTIVSFLRMLWRL